MQNCDTASWQLHQKFACLVINNFTIRYLHESRRVCIYQASRAEKTRVAPGIRPSPIACLAAILCALAFRACPQIAACAFRSRAEFLVELIFMKFNIKCVWSQWMLFSCLLCCHFAIWIFIHLPGKKLLSEGNKTSSAMHELGYKKNCYRYNRIIKCLAN